MFNEDNILEEILSLQEDYRTAVDLRAWDTCDMIADDISKLRGMLGLPKAHPLETVNA